MAAIRRKRKKGGIEMNISLRELTRADVGPKYLGWLRDPRVTEYLCVNSENLTLQDLHAYMEKSQDEGRFNWAITVQKTGLHIGNASVYGRDFENGTYRMGWFIGDRNFWGGRVALQAIAHVLSKGFSETEIHTCIGGVNKAHTKARLNNRLVGFIEQPSQEKPEGQYLDLTLSEHRWHEKIADLGRRFPSEFSSLSGSERRNKIQ